MFTAFGYASREGGQKETRPLRDRERSMHWIGSVARGIVELLAQRVCPGCDGELAVEETGFCSACAPLLEPSHGGVSAYAYGGPLAYAIQNLKYRARADLAPALAELWLPRIQHQAGRVDTIIPMPLHPVRLRQRGFNQVSLLARPISRAFGIPMKPMWLTRIRDTESQSGLDATSRQNNVRGAFRASHRVRGHHILLIDDVKTTGATLTSAKEALQKAGAKQIFITTLAGVSIGTKQEPFVDFAVASEEAEG